MKIDLGELMRERSAAAEATLRTDRVAEVRRRIRLVRRRRTAGVITSTVAVVIAVAAAAVLLPRHPELDPGPAATTMRTIDGFPEYQGGARVIGTAVAELPDNAASVRVVPDTLDLAFTYQCDTPLRIEVRVAGDELLTDTLCIPDGGAVQPIGPEALSAFGVAPGEPATFVATATAAVAFGVSDTLPLPEHGRFALAVMQRVPFEEYPLPTPPAYTHLIDYMVPDGAELLMRSDPLDPNRPVSSTLAWTARRQLLIISIAPGFVHIAINGVPVATHESWDYRFALSDVLLGNEGMPQFEEGALVTVTAEPDHMTRDWGIWIPPVFEGSADGPAPT